MNPHAFQEVHEPERQPHPEAVRLWADWIMRHASLYVRLGIVSVWVEDWVQLEEQIGFDLLAKTGEAVPLKGDLNPGPEPGDQDRFLNAVCDEVNRRLWRGDLFG